MALGPGKYDDLATIVREQTDAHGVIVVVLGGKLGSGFCVQAREGVTMTNLPALLRRLADDIERDTQGDAP